MNIAIIGSGGDGSGMNECIYNICKTLKNHKIILFEGGLQGIINDKIANVTIKDLQEHRFEGGIQIKTGRSSEFMTTAGFNKCVRTLKKYNIELLIILGGNGSLKAAKRLSDAKINTILIPTTIDNDIKETDYSIGFDTAIFNAVDYISKVDQSMQAFSRICIYEVMGRKCDLLAKSVAQRLNAGYLFISKCTKTQMLEGVRNYIMYNSNLPIIIVQENIKPLNELEEFLAKHLDYEIKSDVVGYVQRGGNATKYELEMANNFAKHVAKCVKNKTFNIMISYNKNSNSFNNVEF